MHPCSLPAAELQQSAYPRPRLLLQVRAEAEKFRCQLQEARL
jgi:hypothetical protein